MSKDSQSDGETKRDNPVFFVTKTSYLSIESDVHCLLYLVELVKEGESSTDSLNPFLFSSRTRQAMFRSARSLSGIHPTRVNFTGHDFLHRSQKLCALKRMKNLSQAS